MKVFKFGGASIKSAHAVENMGNIISRYIDEKIVVVVSAMGKTTNALEVLVEKKTRKDDYIHNLENIYQYHLGIIHELFPDHNHPVYSFLKDTLEHVKKILDSDQHGNYNLLYDQVVSNGEIISSTIISHYLREKNVPVHWLDAREYIKTDSTFREGKVNWGLTRELIQQDVPNILMDRIILTQGFIGSNPDKLTTTLGREGSDFTAAIFATCLQGESVTIWKDVPGVLNADPKVIRETIKYEELPYQEAAEMTYYGASVIHPKTIKPLANDKIPLFVRSFAYPDEVGTCIHDCNIEKLTPAIIFKYNQCLITFHMKDLAFINERNLSIIFHVLDQQNLKINLMQNSAVSFSICVDNMLNNIESAVEMLQNDFRIRYNQNLTLVTVKNYDQPTIEKVIQDKNILLEQKTRNTFQIVFD